MKQLRWTPTQYNQVHCMRGSVGQTGKQTGTVAYEHEDICLHARRDVCNTLFFLSYDNLSVSYD